MDMQQIEFDPANLLWRTRGKYWDFEFISTPTSPRRDAWWVFFNEVFSISSADSSAKTYYGYLETEKEEKFVAMSCHDSSLTDWTGRRIQHFLIWFPAHIQTEQNYIECLPHDWHQQILEHLRPFFESEDVFNISEEKLSNLSASGEKLGDYFKKVYLERVNLFFLENNHSLEFSSDGTELQQVEYIQLIQKSKSEQAESTKNISGRFKDTNPKDMVRSQLQKFTQSQLIKLLNKPIPNPFPKSQDVSEKDAQEEDISEV